MNQRVIANATGKLMQLLAAAMCLPLVIACIENLPLSFPATLLNPEVSGFCIAIVLLFGIGSLLAITPMDTLLSMNTIREGFIIVTLGWVIATVFGCIPLFIYFLARSAEVTLLVVLHCYTDAFFEIMSGFTTTGATVISDVEILPKGLLFWRSMTHWLGGMGIVTLGLALFPAFGITAYQMFRGEVPGPSAERLRPRLAQTAKILWGVYMLLTAVETVLLMFGGMSLFDAVCHAFGTMATGGFSTKNSSIAAYRSSYIDWVVIVFMFLAGVNFILHYQILFFRRFDIAWHDREFRFYVSVILAVICIGTVLLTIHGVNNAGQLQYSYRHAPPAEEAAREKILAEEEKVSSPLSTFRYIAFQTISLTTTTGYTTADFDLWPHALRLIFVICMFFGGCAGSTGGGIKMIRIVVVLKAAWREVVTMVQPRLILPLKIARTPLNEKQVVNITGFFILFITLFAFFSVLMSLMVPDFTTAITSVVATMCNIGPGLSGIGATENYGWIPLPGKWILSLCMLLGRLEVYTVVIALSPAVWKK